MRSFGLAPLTALLLPLIASADPVVPGLSHKHPLTEPQIGQVLMGELRCLACHTRKEAARLPEKAAPDLADVGSRVAPDFLRRFIASPSSAHAGTTMPDLLTTGTAEQRNKTAEAITHFLVAQSSRPFQPERKAAYAAEQIQQLEGRLAVSPHT